jgi:hypothetical protein
LGPRKVRALSEFENLKSGLSNMVGFYLKQRRLRPTP